MSPNLTISETDSGVISFTLSGHWTDEISLDNRRLLQEKTDGSNRIIKLIAGEDFHWDQYLATFIYSLSLQLKETGNRLDITRMPKGLQDIVQLANAITPNKSVQQGPRQPFAPFSQTLTNFYETTAFIGEMTLSLLRLLTFRSHMRFTDAISAFRQAGPQALGIISLISLLVGMILAYLGMIQLQQFGAEVYIANLVGLGMVREMGPLMTAVIMAGRTGAAWAAELGAMKVNEEVDALTTMGIRPIDFLVMPRLLAMVIMMPLLCIYSYALGMLGGGIVALGMDMTARMYLYQLMLSFGPVDMIVGCFKGLVFGILITLAGCQAGMGCGSSSAAVGQATTRAVVTAIVFFVVADAGMNILFFHLGI